MELLDAIEELEQPAHSSRCSPPLHDYDCVERQVLFVQRKLRDVWQRKRGSSTEIPRIPFNWVFSKLLRLIEEYPDGLTEAVVVTEMVKLLKQKEAEQDVGASSKKRKIRDEEDMGDLLAEAEQEALHAKVTGYGNHRLTIEMENVKDVTAHM
ncbi:hypothetical protein P3T76_007411 [Phytophthora citrophthora]|uniref:Cell division control protein 24 OB domain-containing protein n=1 Tax=Phytophthora citrophthora TaxID=4793 RepID=A0AAD9GMV9_9STRA|nr:hypothetical protein P3T76_007411 [Phytophthora citrophthora]